MWIFPVFVLLQSLLAIFLVGLLPTSRSAGGPVTAFATDTGEADLPLLVTGTCGNRMARQDGHCQRSPWPYLTDRLFTFLGHGLLGRVFGTRPIRQTVAGWHFSTGCLRRSLFQSVPDYR